MKKILYLVVLTLSLQGCFFVGAAAGAAAVAVVYDHRKVETILADQKISSKIADKINAVPALRSETHVSVTCFNQVVLLTGEATSPELRQQAENLARSVPNVKRIYNEITVKGPTSSLTRASDTWITTKIKTQMLATAGLKSSSIKVVTENGTVYLMGIVSRDQADTATDIARQVSGVQKVVKIFQYTNEGQS
jgi:osmotically-inducible protein OsmY